MMSGKEISILIADDHPIVRSGLAQLLNSEPGLRVIAEADDGEQAMVDEQLPVAVIFLTMHKNEALLNSALDLGVKGYVLKDSAMADIINAIRAVTAGEEFLSPALSKYLIRRSRRAAVFVQQQPSRVDLTPTERKVLALIAQGQTSKAIAETLCISPRTVDHHRANITDKLGLKGHNALLRFAYQHKGELE
jgi:DNA-binding NarL/FixJ family response regulator